jgi:hypothetical protein
MIAAMVLAALGSGANALAAPVTGGRLAREPAKIEIQYWRGGHCERLRRACLYKEQRGEAGEGNCRRYRAECSQRLSYCGQLRRACLYKEERGEVGEGNCRRYRRDCGGRHY